MKRTSVLLLLLTPAFVLLNLTSCEKEEGKGGTSSITGRVVVHQYNTNFTTLVEQYDATDEDVFIIYGDDVVYGDKTSTNYDGTFRFDYLREGTYTVFAYSEDSAGYPSQREIPIMKSVSISDKNQEIKVPVIIILK